MSHQIINVVIVLLNSFRLFPLIDTFFLNHVNTSIPFFLQKKKKPLHFTLATTRIWEIEEGNFGNSLLLNIGGEIQ